MGAGGEKEKGASPFFGGHFQERQCHSLRPGMLVFSFVFRGPPHTLAGTTWSASSLLKVLTGEF